MPGQQRRAAAVLEGVGEFVREQPAAFGGGRSILAGAKGDVLAAGISERVDTLGSARGGGVRVDADGREVMSETGLEEGAFGGAERLPAGRDRVGRRSGGMRSDARAARLALDAALVVFLAAGADPRQLVPGPAEAADRERRRGRRGHPHDALGNRVRLALVGVAGIADRELGVQPVPAEEG